MKRSVSTLLLAALFSAVANAAETPPTEQQLLSLIKEIQAQQATIADNQSKIDSRMAAVAEALRVARIYSSRGGR